MNQFLSHIILDAVGAVRKIIIVVLKHLKL